MDSILNKEENLVLVDVLLLGSIKTLKRSLLSSRAKNPFLTGRLEAKRSVVAHFNSLDLNVDEIFSFEEFDEA